LKNLLAFGTLLLLALLPGTAASQTVSGPHAFDWMLGNWMCKNAIPSPLAGPAVQILTATRSSFSGSIVWRYTGTDYDQYGFLTYEPRTATWWMSWAYPGGSVGNESSRDRGKVTHWTGMIANTDSGKTEHIRDTYTVYGPNKFNYFGEDDATGTMKPSYNGTCTRS
jgi:hypothetical protein